MAPHEPKRRFPAEPLNGFLSKMDRLFAEKPSKGLLQSMDAFFSSSGTARSFPVEVEETDRFYRITATLPGIPKKQIDIRLLQQAVTISAVHKSQTDIYDESKQTVQKETFQTRLSRTIPLANPVDEKNISAKHRDGVLILTIPKIIGKPIRIIE